MKAQREKTTRGVFVVTPKAYKYNTITGSIAPPKPCNETEIRSAYFPKQGGLAALYKRDEIPPKSGSFLIRLKSDVF